MKTCSTCKVEKLLIEFSKNKSNKGGYRCQCRLCFNQYSKQYRMKNKIATSKYNKQWYIDNPEYFKQYHKEYYQTAQGKLLKKAYKHQRKVLLKANTPIGKHWTPQDIILKLKLQHGKCNYCKTSIIDYYEIDHFIPVVKGGSNEAWNIQLLCKNCNGKGGKGRKDAHEFAQQHGKLF